MVFLATAYLHCCSLDAGSTTCSKVEAAQHNSQPCQQACYRVWLRPQQRPKHLQHVCVCVYVRVCERDIHSMHCITNPLTPSADNPQQYGELATVKCTSMHKLLHHAAADEVTPPACKVVQPTSSNIGATTSVIHSMSAKTKTCSQAAGILDDGSAALCLAVASQLLAYPCDLNCCMLCMHVCTASCIMLSLNVPDMTCAAV
jgi:phage FluMu protein Com